MTRVSDAAANTTLISHMLRTQQRMRDANYQVTSGKISDRYSGVTSSAQRLVYLENSRDMIDRNSRNNETAKLRMDLASKSIDSVETIIKNFRKTLSDFRTSASYEKDKVQELQKWAFQAMVDMQDALNSQADGVYLFGGPRTDTAPVNMDLGSFSSFQNKYDGAQVRYPTTRTAHLAEFTKSADANNRDTAFIENGNWLIFRQDDDGNTTTTGSSTIEAPSAMFSGLTAGSRITVSGTASNNGSYRVESVSSDNTKITVTTEMLTAETALGSSAVSFTLADATALSGGNTGTVTFDRSANTITATTAGAFSGASAGEIITVAGTNQNNGTYTIASVSTDGKTVTVESTKLTDEGLSAGNKFFDYTIGTQTVVDVATRKFTAQTYAGTAIARAFSDMQVGDSVTIAGTAGHDNTYTVETVATDGSYFTVASAPALGGANETDTNGTVISVATRGFSYTTGTEVNINTGANTLQIVNQTTGLPDQKALAGLRAGMLIKLNGAPTAANDGTYLISAVNTTTGTLTLDATTPLNTTETYTPVSPATGYLQVFAAAGTVTASSSYYQGESASKSHRVDENRTVDVDILATDPAFEKAIRAMGIIAQGDWGTEGGLDQNRSRVTEALYLLNSSLDSSTEGVPPYGTELESDIESVHFELGFNQYLVDQAITSQKNTINRLNEWIDDAENVDQMEAITKLLDEQRSLEASYQAMSRVFSMNLADYL